MLAELVGKSTVEFLGARAHFICEFDKSFSYYHVLERGII